MRTLILCAAGAAIAFVTTGALARPVINGAVVNTRIFNDDSNSILTTNNLYPASISIRDAALDGDGGGGEFANRHNFRLSADGGTTAANFANSDGFSFFADVTITGPANAEGGLNVSPWFSQNVDGVFMLNGANGEIAVFGGRLPFYSFTVNHGATYTTGTTARLGVVYDPHSLNMGDPGTIQYFLTQGANNFSSPIIPFDQGNPNEDPPYGLWGILNQAQVGGYFQPQIQVGNPDNFSQIVFGNMVFIPSPAALTLLGLAGLAATRRRR